MIAFSNLISSFRGVNLLTVYFAQVEATGVEKLANAAIDYVRRGGTLMLYGVYENSARVHWSPNRIFGDEITVSRALRVIVVASDPPFPFRTQILGSFSQTHCFPRAVEYLESGKISVKGMVRNSRFPLFIQISPVTVRIAHIFDIDHYGFFR